MRLRGRIGRAHLRDDLRRRVRIGLAEVEEQRTFRLAGQIGRQSRAVEGDRALELDLGRGAHDDAAAPAEAEYRHAARPAHAVGDGGDVEHHLVEGEVVGEVAAAVRLAERHHGAGRDAIVQRRDDRVVAVARVGAHDVLQLIGDAEDLLQDDEATLRRARRRGAEGLELEAVSRGDAGHAVADLVRHLCILPVRAGTLWRDGAIHQMDYRYGLHWQRECHADGARRVKPSRCRPAAISGQLMNSRHRSAERWFSIITTIGP